jgi:hypothetical protein
LFDKVIRRVVPFEEVIIRNVMLFNQECTVVCGGNQKRNIWGIY